MRNTLKNNVIESVIVLCSLVWLSIVPLPAISDDASQDGDLGTPYAGEIVAIAGDTRITRAELDLAYQQSIRQKYYHGKPPRGELEALRRIVANELIERSLLLQYAEREGIESDRDRIAAVLEGYRKRYGSSPRWQAQGHEMEGKVSRYLGEQDVLRQLEARIRTVAPPSEPQLREFYNTNPDMFTEPAQHHVSLILLKVPPYAERETWQAALARAAGLVAKLRSDADFADMARSISDDESAGRGGDMGYLHSGMLSPAAQEVIEALEVGAVSDPVRLLDGIAIIRAEGRKPARLRQFDEVRVRAEQLWVRERSDSAWSTFTQRLVEQESVQIMDRSLLTDAQTND